MPKTHIRKPPPPPPLLLAPPELLVDVVVVVVLEPVEVLELPGGRGSLKLVVP